MSLCEIDVHQLSSSSSPTGGGKTACAEGFSPLDLWQDRIVGASVTAKKSIG
jgi:hypothetical protein